ncbi:hypothetical protein L3X38_013633 [Prunus dulcis]|uniref:RNase H type-1 domain-containing protein n=1 Tax=Prunus dulcis TaxID=3755 RepID=A0AAD4ZHJ7_PRUDU|nr:hypothetical protein L3X38_013633 [Prunus dulcis]
MTLDFGFLLKRFTRSYGIWTEYATGLVNDCLPLPAPRPTQVASTAEGGVGLVAIAAREGAILAVERSFTNYIIGSDSLQIVSALRTTTTDRYVISPIVEDTKSLLSPIIGDVITHICRTANRVADRMARFARNIGTVATWFEEPLDFIIDLLFDDCNYKFFRACSEGD